MSNFKRAFQKILSEGKMTSPRGQKTLEITNAKVQFHPYERFASFPSRKLSLNYIRDELKWYLRGDPMDLSICDKAKLWQQMVTDGRLNSNYGKYIFVDGQLDYVVECLTRDPDSRRALITILGSQHLYLENKDVPCTVSLGFTIRGNELLCTAHMRSTDAVFGMSNDIPFFSFVHECVLMYLQAKDGIRPVRLGKLTLFSESLHVYEKHWPMLEAIAKEDPVEIACPHLGGYAEVDRLRALCFDEDPTFHFTTWLNKRDVKA